LNAKGVIPESAVLKRGQRRTNGFREQRRFDLTGFQEGEKTDLVDEDSAGEDEEEKLDKKALAEMEG
jgi:tRNA pseudouridine38-40 synthase